MRDFMHLNTIKPKAYDGTLDTSVIRTPSKAPKVYTAYGLFTEDGLDGTEYTVRGAKKEAKDLRAMGCTVKALQVIGTDIDGPLDMIHDAIRDGKAVGKSLLAKVNEAYPMSTVTLAKGV